MNKTQKYEPAKNTEHLLFNWFADKASNKERATNTEGEREGDEKWRENAGEVSRKVHVKNANEEREEYQKKKRLSCYPLPRVRSSLPGRAKAREIYRTSCCNFERNARAARAILMGHKLPLARRSRVLRVLFP